MRRRQSCRMTTPATPVEPSTGLSPARPRRTQSVIGNARRPVSPADATTPVSRRNMPRRASSRAGSLTADTSDAFGAFSQSPPRSPCGPRPSMLSPEGKGQVTPRSPGRRGSKQGAPLADGMRSASSPLKPEGSRAGGGDIARRQSSPPVSPRRRTVPADSPTHSPTNRDRQITAVSMATSHTQGTEPSGLLSLGLRTTSDDAPLRATGDAEVIAG